MATTYSGIFRAAPAPGRCKFLVQGRQAPQVTSLGTLPKAGRSLALLIQLWPPGGPVSRAVLEWGDCVLRAGPGILPSFLTPFSQGTSGRSLRASPRSWDEMLPWDFWGVGGRGLTKAAVCGVSFIFEFLSLKNCSDRDLKGVVMRRVLATGIWQYPPPIGR